ncbi:MAG TPA: thiamine-phosphate kinase [bacterium]|nr:thiamine-phosphate kinase [bacterium]
MKLGDLGESGFLELVRDWTSGPAPGVVLGVGDDAALLEPPGRGRQVVISTDAWVEGVHFSRTYLAADEIGHRCMAGSLSDLAAMGAEGFAAFVNVHAPGDLEVDFLRGLYLGMERIADSCGVTIAGGDTVRGQLALDITAVGTVRPGEAVLRSGARAGDVICVSGELGRAEAGRLLCSGEVARDSVPERLCAVAETGHRTPRPRFDVAKLLASLERRTVDLDRETEAAEPVRPTAMIDVSDGLALDLRRLCTASGVGCLVEERLIPVDGAARRIARERKQSECALALGGGEDFELLFTIAERDMEILTAAATKAQLTIVPVGRTLPASGGLRLLTVEGEEVPLPETGFDHFRAANAD